MAQRPWASGRTSPAPEPCRARCLRCSNRHFVLLTAPCSLCERLHCVLAVRRHVPRNSCRQIRLRCTEGAEKQRRRGTEHGGAEAAEEGAVGALAHESARSAHDGAAAGVHRQAQPQRVQRVRHLRSSSRHSSGSCARARTAAPPQNANAIGGWRSLFRSLPLDAIGPRLHGH